MWYLYILECSDKTFYTGITNNIYRRIEEHNTSNKGAKYTKGRRPVKLVYLRKKKTKITASKEEYRIKKLTREEKIKMILSSSTSTSLKPSTIISGSRS